MPRVHQYARNIETTTEETAMPPPPELSALKGLSAPILSDVMDTLGLMHQAMRPFVRPLDEASVLVGRARTGLYMPVYSTRGGDSG